MLLCNECKKSQYDKCENHGVTNVKCLTDVTNVKKKKKKKKNTNTLVLSECYLNRTGRIYRQLRNGEDAQYFICCTIFTFAVRFDCI